MAKLKFATYKWGSFCGVRNKNFEVTTCKGNFLIPSKIQGYVLN